MDDRHADRRDLPGGVHPRRDPRARTRRGAPGAVRRSVRDRRVRARPQGAVPPGRVRGRADEPERTRRGRVLPGRVLRAHALFGARHGDDGLGARPDLDLRRTRAAVDPRLHDGGLAQTVVGVERSGREVLPARCVRVGDHAVRHVVSVRHDRNHQADRDRCRTHRRGTPRARSRRCRVRDRRVRLQGVGRAVPQLGARHLRGCAHAGHRVLVGGVEGRRLRGADDADLRGVPECERRLRSADLGDGGADDDRRQRAWRCVRRTSCACSPTPR